MYTSNQTKDLDALAFSMGAIKKANTYHDNNNFGGPQREVFSVCYFNSDNKEVLSCVPMLTGSDDIDGLSTVGVSGTGARHLGSIAANELRDHSYISPAAKLKHMKNMHSHTIVLKEDVVSIITRDRSFDIQTDGTPSDLIAKSSQYLETLELASWLGFDLDKILPILSKEEAFISLIHKSGEANMPLRAFIAFAFEHDPKIRENIVDSCITKGIDIPGVLDKEVDNELVDTRIKR